MTISDRENKINSGNFDFSRLPILIITLAVIFSVAYWLAFCLRFDFAVPTEFQVVYWISLPFLLVIQLCCFAAFAASDGQRGRFKIGFAFPLLFGFLMFAVLDSFVLEIHIPRSVHILNLLIAMALVASFRSIGGFKGSRFTHLV